MTPPFRDRVTGLLHNSLPSTALPGRWSIQSDAQTEAPARFDGRIAEDAEFAIPTNGLTLHWTTSDGASGITSFEAHHRTDETTRETVGKIALRLQERSTVQTTWASLLDVVPVAPGIVDRTKLTTLDHHIAAWSPHLAAVCHRPRSELNVELERTPVSRVKRVAPGAAEYLASHTEDWRNRSLRGVEPYRVLAHAVDDDLDIYENRVAARLVDHLLAYLRARIDDVSRVQWLLDDAHTFSHQAVGTHWRKNRIFMMWGHAYESGDATVRAQVSEALAFLSEVQHRLLKLLDSPLYRAVPHLRRVPATLRMTNILASDQRYKWVARLWLLHIQQVGNVALSPEVIALRQRQFCDDWNDFALLVVVHSLSDLGFEPDSPHVGALYPGAPPLCLSDGLTTISLEWQSDGAIILSDTSRAGASVVPLRLVPIAAALSGGPDEAAVRESLAQLGVMASRPVEARKSPTAVPPVRLTRRSESDAPRRPLTRDPRLLGLYPGIARERDRFAPEVHRALETLQNDGDQGPSGSVGLVPISPLSVDSAERVGRALRWWLSEAWSQCYPPSLLASGPLLGVLHANRLTGTSQDVRQLTITAPLTSEHRAQIDAALNDARNQPRGRANPVARITNAEVAEFDLQLDVCQSVFARLLACPTCGRDVPPRLFEARDGGLFSCRCEQCETRWGLRGCGSCGDRFPYLVPIVSELPTDRSSGWIDRTFGRDVLAIPCACDPLATFRCPSCGTCPERSKSTRHECARCDVPDD